MARPGPTRSIWVGLAQAVSEVSRISCERLWKGAERALPRRCAGAAQHLDQLSRPDPRGAAVGEVRGAAGAAGTTISPGRIIAPAPPPLIREADRAAPAAWARAAPGAGAAARALAARRHRLRPRRPRLERGTRAAALRVALRGGARSRRPCAATAGRRRSSCPAAPMTARPSPHSRHRHRPAARQDQIPPGRVRADAADLHPAAVAAQRRGACRPAGAQAEFPPADRTAGTRRGNRRDRRRHRRAAGQAVPLPARGAAPNAPIAGTKLPALARLDIDLCSGLSI